LGLPRSFAPLPESGAAGKTLLLDVLFAETFRPLESPTAADLLEQERAGKLKSNARVRLLLVENQPGFTQFGELATRVSGRVVAGPSVLPSYSSMNVGTMVQATGRMEADGTILVQIYIEKTALVPSDLPPEQREPESITRLLTQTTVRLAAGEPSVLSAGPANGAEGAGQMWVVVACKPQ
jgi:hypothetical protein